METLKTAAELSSIPQAIDYIENELRDKKIKNKYILETLLLSEESIVQLIENTTHGKLYVSVKKSFPITKIKLSAFGKEFIPEAQGISAFDSMGDRESETAIRNLVFQNYASRIKYVNKGGCNFMEIAVGMPEKTMTFFTAGIFLFSLIAGILLKLFLPEGSSQVLNEYVLIPVLTLFMNALKLSAAPMMFLSIITNFAKYSSFSGIGKVNIKTGATYFITSVTAAVLGWISYNLLDPGISGEMPFFSSGESLQNHMGIGSYPQILTDIIPDNIITPFTNMNSIQLIVLALICGIALGNAGKYSKPLQDSAQALSTLCEAVASMVNKVIPVVVFFATTAFVLNTELRTAVSFIQMYGALIVGLLFMLIFYILIIFVFGRLNPFLLIKKYSRLLHKTLFTGSSVAAMPDIIKFCKNKLGIHEKIYSFTIPFGAMANMDGNCIYLTVACLFAAKISGMHILGSAILPFILSVLILSVGAPIASGSVLICMSMLLSQFGVSIGAVTLFIGLNSITEMLLAAFDSFGDIAVSVIIANKEKMLSKEIYNSDT